MSSTQPAARTRATQPVPLRAPSAPATGAWLPAAAFVACAGVAWLAVDAAAGPLARQLARGPVDAAAARVSALVGDRLAVARQLAREPLLEHAVQRLDIRSMPGHPPLPPNASDLAPFDARLSPSHLLEPEGEPSRWLRATLPLLGGASSVFVTDAHGFAAAGSSHVQHVFNGGSPWWKEASRTGEAIWLAGAGSGLPVDAFCVAVRLNARDRTEGGGVLAVLYPVHVLVEPLRAAGGRIGTAFLVDAGGSVLASGADTTADLAAFPQLTPLGRPGEPIPATLRGPGGEWLVARLAGEGPARRWLVAAPSRPANHPTSPLLAAAACGLLGAAAAYAAARTSRRAVTGRLRQEAAALAAYVEQTGAGGRTVPPPALSELAPLSSTLTAALEPLRSSRAELDRSCRTLTERLAARTGELSRLTQELQKRTEELAAASRGKEQFLGVMSHELRTPLNSIIGLTQLVRDGAVDSPEEARAFLDQVLQSAREQLRLINDVLEVAHLESGKLVLALAAVPVAPVVDEALGAALGAAAAKGLKVRRSIAPDCPPAWADRARLCQVLASLVDNAVKFTPSGGIEVRASASDGRRKILVEVIDTGVGIPEEKRATVFEKFIQAEAGVGRRFGGAGLGLPISRLLVEAMGGRIGIESAGSGTRVWFTVPAPGREGR